jgi:hypothetical protein
MFVLPKGRGADGLVGQFSLNAVLYHDVVHWEMEIFLFTSKECDFFLTRGSHLPTKSVVFYKHEVRSTNLRPVLWTICVYDSSPTNSAQ